jgi:hypothetical protein
VLEWTLTLLFTAEYLARLLCVRHPLRYARSFYGVIDLLAVLPTYLAVLVPGLHALIDVRVLRLCASSGSSSSAPTWPSTARWARPCGPPGARSWSS